MTLAVVCGAGCAPRFPNDVDHAVEVAGCPACHFGGDAGQAPESHWDGQGNLSYDYEACLHCHRPL